MASPRVAKLAGTVLWSDGSLFQGFAVIGLIVPTLSGVSWPELSLEPNSPRERIPLWSTIPIKNGVFNQALGLWFTDDINPPNTKYAIWYYDSSNVQIAGPVDSSDFFTVTADPTTPPMYSLVAPTAGVAIPDPGEGSVPGGLSYISLFVDAETPIGSITSTNGINGNGVFTLLYAPDPVSSLRLIRNGVSQLAGGVDFTLSGNTITYVSGRKPVVGDWHIAYYRRSL